MDTAVTLISLGLGYGLRELLPQAVVPWLAALLFLVFGVKLLLDAQGMAADAAGEEAEEAEEAINAAETRKPLTTPWAVIWEAFVLVFLERRAAGRPISFADCQIAATARAHGAAMATRNITDFAGCGIAVIDPWAHQQGTREPS